MSSFVTLLDHHLALRSKLCCKNRPNILPYAELCTRSHFGGVLMTQSDYTNILAVACHGRHQNLSVIFGIIQLCHDMPSLIQLSILKWNTEKIVSITQVARTNNGTQNRPRPSKSLLVLRGWDLLKCLQSPHGGAHTPWYCCQTSACPAKKTVHENRATSKRHKTNGLPI